jgi:hypothetical protein
MKITVLKCKHKTWICPWKVLMIETWICPWEVLVIETWILHITGAVSINDLQKFA